MENEKEEGIEVQGALNLEEVKEVIKLIVDNNISEFDIEKGGMRLRIKRGEGKSIEYIPVAASPVVASQPQAIVTPIAVQPVVDTGAVSVSQVPTLQGAPLPDAAKVEEEDISKYHTVKSPMVGTFYRSPTPDAAPYVEIGDIVNENTVLCIIEAMKLMNEIKSDIRGKIHKILVKNNQPVEYGQPMLLIEPL